MGAVFSWYILSLPRPTGWLPTTFDPGTGISTQVTAVYYHQPPQRGRIHMMAYKKSPPLSLPTCFALPFAEFHPGVPLASFRVGFRESSCEGVALLMY